MGCGASVETASLAISTHQQRALSRSTMARSRLEVNTQFPEIEQVVNYVHLITDTLCFRRPDSEAAAAGAVSSEAQSLWQMGFSFDAEKPGTATVCWGGAVAVTQGAMAKHPSAEEVTDMLRGSRQEPGDTADVDKRMVERKRFTWKFGVGHCQDCPREIGQNLGARVSATAATEPTALLGKVPASRKYSLVCTVVIHLECGDNEAPGGDDTHKVQSQTTVALVELSDFDCLRDVASAAPACRQPHLAKQPRIKLLSQKLLVRGVLYDMLDVFGLDSCLYKTRACAPPPPSPQLDTGDTATPLVGNGRRENEADSPPLLAVGPDFPSSPKDEEVRTSNALAALGITHSGSCCVICLYEPKDCVLLPCRHLCICEGCAQELLYDAADGKSKAAPCPMCRARVQSVVQLPIRPGRLTAASGQQHWCAGAG